MPLIDITPPPGVIKPGTVYDAKGRWYDTLWVRWFEGVMQAIGGFEAVEIVGSTYTNGTLNEVTTGEYAGGMNISELATASGLPTGFTAYGELAETATGVEVTTAPGTPPNGLTKALVLNTGTNTRWGLGIDAFDDVFQFGEIVTLSRAASSNSNLPGPTFAMSGVTDGTLAHEYTRLRLQGGGTQVGTQGMGHSGGGDTFYGSENDETLTFNDNWIWCRTRVDDAGGGQVRVRANVWTGEYADEPAGWQYDSGTVTPRNTGPTGALGLSAEGFGAAAYVAFMSFSTDPDTTVTPAPDDVDGGGGQIDGAERPSGSHSWRNNDGVPLLAWGGPAAIKVLKGGTVFTVTPASGFTAGAADAVITTGNYGNSKYGTGLYGVGDTATTALQEAQSYQMDNYGEDLFFVAHSDGQLWFVNQDGSGGDPAVAALITPTTGSVPTSNLGVVVTPERFVMLLGAGGDGRKIQWPDVDDNTDWLATNTNQAGDIFLPGKGAIMAGRRAQAETLVWTDQDLFSIRYIGGNFVYQATPVGAVGSISRRSMAVVGSVAYWMGPRGFYIYNGFTQAIESPLADFVFSDLNQNQISKIWAEVRAEYGEVTWHYPSGGSTECDRSVTYNYNDGFWFNNTVERTAGEDRGAFSYPMAFDAAGLLYRHETGANYGGAVPQAISGPVEIGKGDNVMHIQSIIPDEKTLGDVDLYLLSSFYPTASETENGPFTPANPTDTRITARQVRLKIVQDQANWRVGTIRADVELGGQR